MFDENYSLRAKRETEIEFKECFNTFKNSCSVNINYSNNWFITIGTGLVILIATIIMFTVYYNISRKQRMREFNLNKFDRFIGRIRFDFHRKADLFKFEKLNLQTPEKKSVIILPKKITEPVQIDVVDDTITLKTKLVDTHLDHILKDEKNKLKDLLAKKKNPELLKTFQTIEKIEEEMNLNKIAQQHPHLLREYSDKPISSLTKSFKILTNRLKNYSELSKENKENKLEIKTRLMLIEREINDRFQQYQQKQNLNNQELMKKMEKEWQNDVNYKQIPIYNLEEKLKEVDQSIQNYKTYSKKSSSVLMKSDLKQIRRNIVKELNERYETILAHNGKYVKKNLFSSINKHKANEKRLSLLRKKVNKLREKYSKKYSLSDDSLENPSDLLKNEEYFKNASKLAEQDFQQVIQIINQNVRKPDDLSNISKFIQDN